MPGEDYYCFIFIGICALIGVSKRWGKRTLPKVQTDLGKTDACWSPGLQMNAGWRELLSHVFALRWLWSRFLLWTWISLILSFGGLSLVGVKDEVVVRVPGKCCPQCSARSCSAAGQVYEVTSVPRMGVLTYVLTLLTHAFQPQSLPTLLSDSLPGLVTQYINGFYENGPYEKN